MWSSIPALCFFASNCFALSMVRTSSPATAQSGSGDPVVTVKNGSYYGIHIPTYNQDAFLGIPYAQPPVNDFRFRVPQSLNTTWNDTRPATAYSPFCVGYGGDDTGHELSEDCLYLSIIRPSGTTPTSALPVAVWIHGGGLFMGGSNDPRYNLSFITQNSVEMKTPMLSISIQYRLSAWGFLGGKEALEGGATNLGFRDQRLALHWIQENIAAFGGDKGRVTIWGESAGAQSVGAQLLAYNGRNDNLFRSAIAESGGPGNLFFPLQGGYNSTLPQLAYNTLISNTSCSSTLGTPSSLDCLRSLPFAQINAALNISTQGLSPFAPALDHDFISTYPSLQLNSGNFVPVPLLIGTNTDEGTAFGAGYPVVNTDSDFISLLNSTSAGIISPSSANSQIISALYPNIQALGIPSLDTSPELITPESVPGELYGTQFRRLAAYFGDLVVVSPRRSANIAWSNYNIPSYAYRFDVTVNGVSDWVGATHFQEVAFVFNNTQGQGYAIDPFANKSIAFQELAHKMSRSWVGFITALDPNVGREEEWPVYNATTGGGVGWDYVWSVNGSKAEEDSWRGEGISWIGENALSVYGR